MHHYGKRKFFGIFAMFLLCMALPSLASAWVTIKGDGDRSFKLGAGFRSSFTTSNNAGTDAGGNASDFTLDNMRLYTLTQVHKNIIFEFNTEVRNNGAANLRTADNNGNTHDIHVLDARATLSIGGFDLWFGKFLPPSERSNLDGPYFLNVYNFPLVTSPYPAIAAGRDNGTMIFKEYGGGKFKCNIYHKGTFAGTNNYKAHGDPKWVEIEDDNPTR